MKKLKFSNDHGSVFYIELRQSTDEYFKKKGIAKTGNSKMYFKIFLYFGLDVLFYFLMINSDSLLSFYTFYLLMGLSVLLTAFNISHDAAHGVAVKSKFWNKFLFQASFNLQGNNAYVWGKNHNESHHLYTNVEESDIDVLHNPLFRMTETQELKPFHKYQYLYAPLLYMLYSINWFLFRDTLLLFNVSSRTIKVKIPLKEAISLVFFKLLYIAFMIAVPAVLLPFSFSHILLAFLINHVIVSLLFVAVLSVSHLSDFVIHPLPDKEGNMNMSWPTLQMATSVDYNSNSVFFNWTLGGFNAHALHHLLPNICHVHYLEILPIFRELCEKHQITYMELPYSGAFKGHVRFLKKMGSEPHMKLMPFVN